MTFSNQAFLPAKEDQLTTVVVVNRQVPHVQNSEQEQSIQHHKGKVAEEIQTRSGTGSRKSSHVSNNGLSPIVGLTPTRYKMGMYLAALQAEETNQEQQDMEIAFPGTSIMSMI